MCVREREELVEGLAGWAWPARVCCGSVGLPAACAQAAAQPLCRCWLPGPQVQPRPGSVAAMAAKILAKY